MIIRTIAKLLALLNSNRRALEVGAAIAMGLWLALVPATNLTFLVLVLIAFLVKINLGMVIVSALVLGMLTPLVDPTLDRLGYWILTQPSLEGFLASAWATPIVPLTRFNDTLVAGGLVSGALLFVPVTMLGIVLVRLYRRHIHARIANSKVVRAFMKLPVVQKIARAMRGLQRVWPTAG